MKTIAAFAFVALVTVPAVAELSRFKEWGNSAQAYFMTKAEREQWTAIKSDTEAEAFIKNFVASRGPGFAGEVEKRVAVADKYLTFGKTPGSETLRGKIIILLGPPASFTVGTYSKRRSGESSVNGNLGMAGDAGASLGDMNEAAQRADMSANVFRTYDFGYTADKLPAAFGKLLNVSVELDTLHGTERITDRKAAANVDALFEMAAAASVKK